MLRLDIANAGKWSAAQKAQWAANNELNKAAESDFVKVAQNAGLSPFDAFREMEERTVVELNPLGEFAAYQRVTAMSRSVNLGKQEYTYRRAGTQTGGQTSMSGQVGIITDAVDFDTAGVPVPIHDHATERNWRDALSMGADGFDAFVDDVRESELVVLRQANDYYWNGDATVKSPTGKTWLGIKGDSTLVQETGGINLSVTGAGASTPEAVYQAVIAYVDTLRIANSCPGMVDICVSQATLSSWQSPFTTSTGQWGTVLQMIESIIGVGSVYADPMLTTGNEIFIAYVSMDGLHAVTGQALSTYMVERTRHQDNFTMVKWLAQSFVSKNTKAGKKCGLYAKA